MHRFSLFLLAALAAVLTGCNTADPVVFAEVFQLEQGQQLRTRCNLWYTDPDNISCLNIQEGHILPAGTVIEPVGTSSNGSITFRDAKKNLYRIKFKDGYLLTTMPQYMKTIFTTDSEEQLFKGIDRQTLRLIRGGKVRKGMSRREVAIACGFPPAIRTPNLNNETWIYWIGGIQTFRVVFRGDKVVNILRVQ